MVKGKINQSNPKSLLCNLLIDDWPNPETKNKKFAYEN